MEQDVLVPWKLQPKPASKNDHATTSKSDTVEMTYQRYYHFFKEGELRHLVMEAAEECGSLERLDVEKEWWEEGNWCIQAAYVQ